MYHVGSIQMPQNDYHAINTHPEHHARSKAFISFRTALQPIHQNTEMYHVGSIQMPQNDHHAIKTHCTLHTKHQSPLNNPKFPYQNTEMYHVGSIQMPQNDHHAINTHPEPQAPGKAFISLRTAMPPGHQNTEMYHVGSIQMPQNDHHAIKTHCTLHTKPLAKHSYLSRQHCKPGLIPQNTEMYHVGSIQMPQIDHHAMETSCTRCGCHPGRPT